MSWVLAAYLIGSISSAILTCRLMGLQDPRSLGSGNPGATNVLRSGSKKAAIITLLGDVLKGLAPVLLAQLAGISGLWLALVALAAFLGHLFPLYHGFKGGKGVATALGVLLALHWLTGLLVLLTWLLSAALTRYSSLSALLAALLAPLYVYLTTHDPWLTGTAVIMSVLVFIRHRRNIANLLAGTEPRIGKKASS
ncbi:glycerol-3-phosphate 1-O-acyltransferase PlsY [Thiorhodospira sibirica]|uniref:glycerol-3-phosphate 1-O-acyltransferase PlsY n=1 Tax=Thiorhodospira sibirica TaxID=154347 RepID=UPI000592A025|nr:glycerol-3-phosphate 1-O-acyltransferase PlsY [Thiorhodospira sibirica]